MRNIKNLLFIIILLSSCKNTNTNDSNRDGITINSHQPDTAKYEDTVLINTIKKITPSTFPECKISITQKMAISEKVFFIVYELSDGVGSTNYLMSFVDNTYKDHEVLAQDLDQDYSITHYEYRALKQAKGPNFIVNNYYKYPADKSVVDDKDPAFFKEDYNFENVEIKTDTTVLSFTVTNNGAINRETIK